jgi:hypothetical protein
LEKVDPAIEAGLMSTPEAALNLMAWKVSSIARVENGWSMNTDTMGVYGTCYPKRAAVAHLGLGANLPEDAIYRLIWPTRRERRCTATMPIASFR